jgi:hypothetical protein
MVVINNQGKKITRFIDMEWILHVMESTHMGAMCNRLQHNDEMQSFSTIVNMEWLRSRVIWKYENLRTRNIFVAIQMRKSMR